MKLLWANIPANPRDKAALLALADGAQVTMVMPYLTDPRGDSQDASRLQDLLLAEQNAQATTSGLAAEADMRVPTDRQRSRYAVSRETYSNTPERIAERFLDPEALEKYHRDNEVPVAWQKATNFMIWRLKQIASGAVGSLTVLDLAGGKGPLVAATSERPAAGGTGFIPPDHYWVMDLAPYSSNLALIPESQYIEGDFQNAPALLNKKLGGQNQVDIATINFALLSDAKLMQGQLAAASRVVKPGGRLIITQPLASFTLKGFSQFKDDMEAIGFTLTVKNVLITEYGKPGTVVYLEFVRTATPTPALLPDFKQR